MDEFITHFAKLISNTIIVHIYSYPHFAIEAFLSSVLCITHLLLIFEVNNLYRRTNVKAAARLRMRHPQLKDVESCSYHTISRLHTQIFPQKIEATATKHSYFAPSYRKLNNKKVSTHSNFGWVISRGDSKFLRNPYTDRVEHMLSISPSEYVRKDKERKSREAGLRSCIHSLTSLLEKALNNETGVMEDESKDAIKKSINAIKENFEHQIANDNFPMMDYGNPSLHSLIGQSLNKKYIRNNLSPPQFVGYSISKHEFEKGDDYSRQRDSDTKICRKNSSGDLSDFFNDKTDESIEVIHADQKIPLKNQ